MSSYNSSRKLARVPQLPDDLRLLLAQHKVTTCRDVLHRTKLELQELVDLMPYKFELLIRLVSEAVCPPKKTVLLVD